VAERLTKITVELVTQVVIVPQKEMMAETPVLEILMELAAAEPAEQE
jgi:hypothetical protein